MFARTLLTLWATAALALAGDTLTPSNSSTVFSPLVEGRTYQLSAAGNWDGAILTLEIWNEHLGAYAPASTRSLTSAANTKAIVASGKKMRVTANSAGPATSLAIEHLLLPINAVTEGSIQSALGYTPATAEQGAKAEAAVQPGTMFYDDFSTKADGDSIINNVTMPMFGRLPWRCSYATEGLGSYPAFKNGGFGDLDSQLWYIGSSTPVSNGVFSFGCEFEGINMPSGLNMSFSDELMLTAPSMGIIPTKSIHTNFTFAGITQGGGYYQADATSEGANDIIHATRHFGITGSPIYIHNASTSGLTTGSVYYMIKLDDDHFKIASTYNNAIAGTAIDIGDSEIFSMKYGIADWTCLNRTLHDEYSFHPTQEHASAAPNSRGKVLIEVRGEYMTMTLDRVGSIIFRSPSLGRRMAAATSINFWYEGSGNAPAGNAGQRIYRVWANSPMMDAAIDRSLDRVYFNSLGDNSNTEDKIGLAGRLLLGPFKANNASYTVGQSRFVVGSTNTITRPDGTQRYDQETALSANGWIGVVGGANAASFGKAPLAVDLRFSYPKQTATTGADVELLQLPRFPFLWPGEYLKYVIRADVAAGGAKNLKLVQYITGQTPFNLDLSSRSGQLTIEITRYTTNLYTDDVYVTAKIGSTVLLENSRLSYTDNNWYPWLLLTQGTAANQVSVQFVECMAYLVRIKD